MKYTREDLKVGDKLLWRKATSTIYTIQEIDNNDVYLDWKGRNGSYTENIDHIVENLNKDDVQFHSKQPTKIELNYEIY